VTGDGVKRVWNAAADTAAAAAAAGKFVIPV